MGRRSCFKHGYRLGLSAGVVVGILLCFALTAQPPSVECRETVKFIEEAGDPDMPDRVISGPVRSSGLSVSLPGNARLLELQPREHSASRTAHRQPWREYMQARRTIVRLLRAWSSVASWQFAF